MQLPDPHPTRAALGPARCSSSPRVSAWRSRACRAADQPPWWPSFVDQLTRRGNALRLARGAGAGCREATGATRAGAGVETLVVGADGACRGDAGEEALAGQQPAVARRHRDVGGCGRACRARVARGGDRDAARAAAPAADTAACACGRARVPRKAGGAPGRQSFGQGAWASVCLRQPWEACLKTTRHLCRCAAACSKGRHSGEGSTAEHQHSLKFTSIAGRARTSRRGRTRRPHSCWRSGCKWHVLWCLGRTQSGLEAQGGKFNGLPHAWLAA